MNNSTPRTVSSRHFPFDLVRALAILGVIAIHCSYPLYARPDFLGGGAWWIAHFLNSISRICVPLFIMISGALLIDKKETSKQNLVRIWRRLGVPLLTWTGVYWLTGALFFNQPMSWQSVGMGYLRGSVFQLYFLFIMINLYALLPAIRVAVKKVPASLLVWGSLGFGLLVTAFSFFVLRSNTLETIMTLWLPYLGYFLAGWYFGKTKLSRMQVLGWWLLWGVAMLSTIALGYWNLSELRNGNMFFWGWISYFDIYTSPNVMVAAVAGFVALVHTDWQWLENSLIAPLIKLLAQSALTMYLVHPLILQIVDVVFKLHIDTMNESLLMFLVIRLGLVIPLSLLVAVVFQKYLPQVSATTSK